MLKNNKFLDIVPPGSSSPALYAGTANLKKQTFFKKGLAAIISIVFIGLGLLCHFVFVRASVNIWPETEFLGFTEEITIDINAKELNFAEKIIPGKYFEEIKNGRQEFSATEIFDKNEKAKGIIKVYNSFNPPRPLTLVSGTRFLSSDSEKYFVSLKKIYIPAGTMEGGKVVPAWVETEIIAMENGENYNIGPTKFSVPGLVSNAYYYTTWGESAQAITGGTSVKIKRVSQGDLDNAQKNLTEKLLREVKIDLEKHIPDDFIYFTESFSEEITKSSSLAPVGAEVNSFTYEADVKASALIVDKAVLEQFAEKFILSRSSLSAPINEDGLFKNKKFLKESLQINYKVKSIDLKAGKIVLDLEFSGKIYPDIDQSILREAFQGKSLMEITVFLKNQPQITKSEVKFWPFWITKAPKDAKKIKIELKL